MSFTTRVVVGVCEEIGAQFEGCAVFFSVKQGLQSSGEISMATNSRRTTRHDVEKTRASQPRGGSRDTSSYS